MSRERVEIKSNDDVANNLNSSRLIFDPVVGGTGIGLDF